MTSIIMLDLTTLKKKNKLFFLLILKSNKNFFKNKFNKYTILLKQLKKIIIKENS